jgi:hypothetical protein
VLGPETTADSHNGNSDKSDPRLMAFRELDDRTPDTDPIGLLVFAMTIPFPAMPTVRPICQPPG